MDEPVAHDGTEGDLSHHPQVTPEGVPHKNVVEVQPLFCLNEVSGGTRHKDPRQCPGGALTKLIRSFKSLHRPNCGPCKRRGRRIRPFDCLSLVDQPHVVRKICWKMVPKGRHILNLTFGSAANCATVLRIVKVRLGHTTRPVIQDVPGHTIVYVRIWRFQGVGLQVETAVKPEKNSIYFALRSTFTCSNVALQSHTFPRNDGEAVCRWGSTRVQCENATTHSELFSLELCQPGNARTEQRSNWPFVHLP